MRPYPQSVAPRIMISSVSPSRSRSRWHLNRSASDAPGSDNEPASAKFASNFTQIPTTTSASAYGGWLCQILGFNIRINPGTFVWTFAQRSGLSSPCPYDKTGPNSRKSLLRSGFHQEYLSHIFATSLCYHGNAKLGHTARQSSVHTRGLSSSQQSW